MRLPEAPVPIVAVGAVSTGAVLWRWRGVCHVTVAAKATFALQHRTWMTPIVPEPIEDFELLPYRNATDVVVTAAHAFSETPTEATSVRMVVRGHASFIDKSLLVYAPRPAGIVAPFQQAAIVKRRGLPQALVIDPKDPSQRGTFGRTDTRVATLRDGGDALVVVDDDVDWSSFQVAPSDQQVRELRGDEWLILEGMTADRPRLESRLPGAVVETRLYARDLWCGRSLLVSMMPTVMSLDVDNHKCSVVWQGSFTLDDPKTATGLVLVSALHTPGGMTSWPTVDKVASSVEVIEHRRKMTALADTDRDSVPSPGREALQARVAARLQSLGPLATLPIQSDTEPVDDDLQAASKEDSEPRMVVQRGGIVMLRPNDPRELSVTDTGTLDLPPDRSELAPPVTQPITLCDQEGAPWGQRGRVWTDDAARRAAGGTVIADDTPPELDDQDMDTLERTLTDSLDEMQGDPIAALFDVERFNKS